MAACGNRRRVVARPATLLMAGLAGLFAGLSLFGWQRGAWAQGDVGEGGGAVAALGGGAATFEALRERATPAVELSSLVTPFLDDCSSHGAARAIDRARCQGVTRFLREVLPARTYVMIVDSPEAVTVSDYDARVRGVRIGVVGCLACQEPVAIGETGQRRLVTLRAPDRGGRSLPESVEVANAGLTFGGVPESKAWLAEVRPRLRTELVFQPENKEWSFGPARGFAFRLLGARVFDHCTGEVVYSVPPSSGSGPRYDEDGSCAGGARGVAASPSEAPGQMSAAEINRAMQEVRPALDRCIGKFNLRGSANIRFTVSGATGVPSSVSMEGSLDGTELGSCLLEAARKARFPQFGAESQKFVYPVMLRR